MALPASMPNITAASLKYFIMPNKRKKFKISSSNFSISRHQLGTLFLHLLIIGSSSAAPPGKGSNRTITSTLATGSLSHQDTHTIVRELGQAAELKCCLQIGAFGQWASVEQSREKKRRNLAGSDTGTSLPVIDETPARNGTEAATRLGRHLHHREAEEEGDEGEEELARADEAVELILWYRLEGSTGHLQPIYSVDARHLSTNPISSTHTQPTAQQDRVADQLVPVLVPVKNGFHPQPTGTGSNTTFKPLSTHQLEGLTANRILTNVIQGHVKQYAAAGLSQRIRLRIGGDTCTYLIIDQVRSSDAGHYKCRVDYRHLRTSYQLNQLHVIAPVTRLRISATVSNDLGVSGGPRTTKNWESPVSEWSADEDHRALQGPVQVVDVEEGETIRLECSAQDGWPKGRLAWWRVDWRPKVATLSPQINPAAAADIWLHANDEQAGSGPWLIRLSSLLSESSTAAQLSAPAARSEAHTNHSEYKFPPTTAYLINATVVGHPQQPTNEVGGQTTSNNNSAHAVGSAHVGPTNQASGRDEAAWLAERLRWALERAFPADSSNNNNYLPRLKTDKSKATLDQLVSLFASQLAAVLQSSTKPQSDSKSWHPKRLLNVSRASASLLGSDEMWQLFCRHRMLMYTCGASNLRPSGEDSEDLAVNPEEPRDKLVRQRPIFRPILIRPRASTRWIRMFLVNRRVLLGGREKIELSPPLRDGQTIHLNLAALNTTLNEQLEGPDAAPVVQRLTDEGSTSGPEAPPLHLQLVCLVEGGSEEANIEWVLSQPERPAKSSQHANNKSDNINFDVRPGHRPVELVSGWGERDTAHDTEQLIKAALRGPDLVGAAGPEREREQCPSYTKQWSSFKLHNISVRQHQTSIKCQVAHPRKRNTAYRAQPSAASSGSSADNEPVMLFTQEELSTSVELNITHVPVLDLKMETSNSWGPEPLVVDNNSVIRDQLAGQTPEPIAYGQNVTLDCMGSFANPPLTGPIEWSINDTELSRWTRGLGNQLPVLVNVVRKLSNAATTITERFNERLIVQFYDVANGADGKPPNDDGTGIRWLQLQLKCTAQNALGRASSQPASLLLGRPPFCLNGRPQPHNPDKLATMRSPMEAPSGSSDKDLAIYCPVISDKNSSTFHWLLPIQSDGHKPVSLDTGSANPVPAAHMVQVLGEAAVDVTDVRRMLESIQCHASDKFGSNQAAQCQTQVVTDIGRLVYTDANQQSDKDDKTVQGPICTAKAVHKDTNETWKATHASSNEPTQIGSKLTALIECRDEFELKTKFPFGLTDIRMVFDLYQKESREHLNRFHVKSNQWRSLNLSSWWIELAFGDESNMTDWPEPQVVVDSYFLVMALLVAGDQEARDVTTIPFVPPNQQQHQVPDNGQTMLLAVSQQKRSPSNEKLDHHYVVSESGRRQHREWIIKGLLGLVLGSSVVLVIGGWLCSKTSNSNTSRTKCKLSSTSRNKDHKGSNSQQDRHDSQAEASHLQQTKMYLVDQPQTDIYPDQAELDRYQTTEPAQDCSIREQQFEAMSMAALAELPVVAPANSLYEHLIVINDPLVGSSESPGPMSIPTAAHLVDSHDICSSSSFPHHWQPSANTFLVLETEPELVVGEHRQNHLSYFGVPSTSSNHQRVLTAAHQLETSIRPRGAVLRSHLEEQKPNLNTIQMDELPVPTSRQVAAAANGLQNEIGSLSLGCNQLELNSQGELTMTDESSSFIHEDSGYNQNGITYNHYGPCSPAVSRQTSKSAFIDSNKQLDECLDCRRALHGSGAGIATRQTQGELSVTSHQHHLLSDTRSRPVLLDRKTAQSVVTKPSANQQKVHNKQQSKQVKFLK